MKTLYLRNVPDDVAENLAILAKRAHMSVGAFAVRELAAAASRATNQALLASLPDLGVSLGAVVEAVHAGRAED